MNALVHGLAAQPTMSSREIAELCEKEHRNVMRDIRSMLVELHGEGGTLKFEHTHRNPQNGQQYPVFNLPKRETLILVSGYKLDLRAKIIDRWQELEERQTTDPMAALRDPATMRTLLLDYSERMMALEQTNAELAPKAQALTRIADSSGSYSITETAKVLGLRPSILTSWMRGEGKWIYRRPGSDHDTAYQDKLDKRLMIHRAFTFETRYGTEKTVTQALVTAKGLAVLAESFDPQGQPKRVYAPNAVRKWRKARGMTMKQLASLIHPPVTLGTIAKLETGQTSLSLDYIREIARALDVRPDQLIGDGPTR